MLSLTVAWVAVFKFFEIRPIRSVKSCNPGCRGVHRSEAGITMTFGGGTPAARPGLRPLAPLTAQRCLDVREVAVVPTVQTHGITTGRGRVYRKLELSWVASQLKKN